MSTIINLKQEGKRYSFYQLLKEKKYSIEIPIIQRDYAQGRKSKGEVRDLFLQALYDYLEDNIPNRDLDFVYGSTEVEEGNEKFIPLDGQQRLTTLFLLHWYLASISENDLRTSTLLMFMNSIPSPLTFTLFSRGTKETDLPTFSLMRTEEEIIGLSSFCLMMVFSWSVLIPYCSRSSSIKGMQSGLPTGGIWAGSPIQIILVLSLLSITFSNRSSLSIETSSMISNLVEFMAGLNPVS